MTTVSAEAKLIPKPPALVDNRKQKSCKTKATQQKILSVSGQNIPGQTPFQVMVLLESKVKENAKDLTEYYERNCNFHQQQFKVGIPLIPLH